MVLVDFKSILAHNKWNPFLFFIFCIYSKAQIYFAQFQVYCFKKSENQKISRAIYHWALRGWKGITLTSKKYLILLVADFRYAY